MSISVELIVDDINFKSYELMQLKQTLNLYYPVTKLVELYFKNWFTFRFGGSDFFNNILSSMDNLKEYIALVQVDEMERGIIPNTFANNISVDTWAKVLMTIHMFYNEHMETLFVSSSTAINNLLAVNKSPWIIRNTYEIKVHPFNGDLLLDITYS